MPGFSCDFWPYGLNNTRVDNDKNKYTCKLTIPGKNKCYPKKIDQIFDFNFFGVSKLNHFGYTITTVPEKFDMLKSNSLREYQELINHNTIKMDLYNEENYPGFPYPEVELFLMKIITEE